MEDVTVPWKSNLSTAEVHFQKFNFSYVVELDASENHVISHGSWPDRENSLQKSILTRRIVSEYSTARTDRVR